MRVDRHGDNSFQGASHRTIVEKNCRSGNTARHNGDFRKRTDRRMDMHLGDKETKPYFEQIALPHLDSAYNLARWLTCDDQKAEDLVQTAFLRAFKIIDGFHGADARAWLLTIVRNTFYSVLRDHHHEASDADFDEAVDGTPDQESAISVNGVGRNPESILASKDVRNQINCALDALPTGFREVLVLKEIDELSYRDIAGIVGIPIGTVMSRLARARKQVRENLQDKADGQQDGM
jgi:RNA polymerase sigma-70 factor (ECF subfamily)